MQQARDAIYRQHGQGYRHDDTQAWPLLEADLSGAPCGKNAEGASKGYFAKQRNRRGRQIGCVLASRYDEIVVQRLYPGTTQLTSARPELVAAAEQTLELDAEKRARTIWRVDAGGGTVAEVNAVLARGYQFHGQDDAAPRAQALAARVSEWSDDPRVPERQVGWVRQETTVYVRPVQRIAVRTRKENGQWAVGVLLSTLEPADVILLTHQPIDRVNNPTAVVLAYVSFYDQRGGGIETAFKEDK
jgi:hypothetical protein